LIGISTFYIKEGFVYNDKSLWLNGSKEYSKLLALQHPSHNVEKVIVDISSDGWSPKAIAKLKSLQLQLMEKKHVVALNTLFNQTSIFNNELNNSQSMVEIVSLFDANDSAIYKNVLENKERYKNFVDIRIGVGIYSILFINLFLM